jgi:ribonuclease HII
MLRGRVIVGVDEAGRGPIIGPMVIAALAFRVENLKALENLGVKDSKELTRFQRLKLAPLILQLAEASIVIIVPPKLLDYYNINRLEENEVVYAIKRFQAIGLTIDKIYIDTIGPPSRLRNIIVRETGIPASSVIVEAKADKRYLPVSAASIVAKVVRDEEIEKLKQTYGVRGSGYPTDAETLEWIREAYQRSPCNPPDFIRRTWSTLKKIAPKWYVEKRDVETRGGQRSLLDYIGRH